MKFYRVAYRQDGGNSAGFSWHTSRREAERRQRQAVADDPGEYDIGIPEIDVINVTPTKAGILEALNYYAGVPDNG